jgi:hypothetical protein
MTDTNLFGSKRLCVNLTPENNDGESFFLTLTTDEYGSILEELSLNSYGSCASFNTMGVFTSKKLFKLAESVLKFELSLQEPETNI